MKLTDGFYSTWKESYIVPEKLGADDVSVKLEEGVKTFPQVLGYRVPLWRLNKLNLNKRIYTTAAATEVIARFGKVVTLALFDHDDGKPSTKDIAAVGKNPQIIGEIMYIDVYIVDESFEKKFEKVVALGGSLGVSSVFDGDINSDGTVFDLELDRWFDLVIDPSYEVFIDSNCPRVDNAGNPLTESVLKIKEGVETKEKNLVKTGITELNMQFGKMIEDAKLVESIDAREKKLNLIESYIDPADAPSLPKVISSIKEAKAEIVEARRLAEEAEKAEAAKLAEKVEVSEKSVKSLLEEKESLTNELNEKNALIENMESMANTLKETNTKQKEILEAVAPVVETKLEDETEEDKKIKESDKVEKSDQGIKDTVAANTKADLALLEAAEKNVADIKKRMEESASAKLVEGSFYGKKCKILEEVTVDDKKSFKIQLVEGELILENIEESAISFTEAETEEAPAEELNEASGDAAANELAVAQAALKKEKEQVKLLRSQLEKHESAPAKGSPLKEGEEPVVKSEDDLKEAEIDNKEELDEAEKTDAETAKEDLKEGVITPTESLTAKKDPANMDHFDESVATANKSTISIAVDQIILDTPALAPFAKSLKECTTLAKLETEKFNLNAYVQREAVKKGTSLKESVVIAGSYGYGDTSNAISLEDI